MKVEITTSEMRPGIVCGSDMKAGDYGLVITDATGGSIVGHYVYRHSNEGRILDLSAPAESWSSPNALRVQLLAPGESITITRTE